MATPTATARFCLQRTRGAQPAPVRPALAGGVAGCTVAAVTARPVDVVVVGAGPAGVAAGIAAQERGLDVLVVDRAEFPRDKTCGDGLTAGALRLLSRLGVDLAEVPGYAPVDEVVLASPSGRRAVLTLPRTEALAAVMRRADLDATLVEHARARGVAVRTGVAVEALRTDGGSVQIATSDGAQISARFVVAADGHYSSVRRVLCPGAARDLGTWHAFRWYVRGVADQRLWVIFERDLLPGYAWSFPLGGDHANVGFGVLRGSPVLEGDGRGHRLRDLAAGLLERASVREAIGTTAVPEGPPRAWPIPAAFHAVRLCSGRTLFAGDAAGVVDPMTGEGIAQALETGILAADAIAGGGGPTRVGDTYRRAVRRTIGRDLRFAGVLQQILRTPTGARAAIRAADLTPWTRRNFARWMWEDYPRAAILTPDRWPALVRAH
jgi:geranylgeranyl reductase family protein